MDLHQIDNLIFDLGGVIVEVDYRLSIQEFLKHSADPDALHYEDFFGDSFLTEYEKGQLSEAEFFENFRERLAMHVSDVEITEAWNAMIVAIPDYGVQLLRRLRSGFRVFILSNTNSLHISCVDKILKVQYGVDGFGAISDCSYYSHQMHKRKPNLDIYQQVIEEQQLLAEKTLFIDDNFDNVEGAMQTGMQGLHLKDMDKLKLIFGDGE